MEFGNFNIMFVTLPLIVVLVVLYYFHTEQKCEIERMSNKLTEQIVKLKESMDGAELTFPSQGVEQAIMETIFANAMAVPSPEVQRQDREIIVEEDAPPEPPTTPTVLRKRTSKKSSKQDAVGAASQEPVSQ